MTDLELTKLCAEAMGYNVNLGMTYMDEATGDATGSVIIFSDQTIYCPLHDDAQAMALVKRCGLGISAYSNDLKPAWEVWNSSAEIRDPIISHFDPDLNRAIVECVAKMQAAKRG